MLKTLAQNPRPSERDGLAVRLASGGHPSSVEHRPTETGEAVERRPRDLAHDRCDAVPRLLEARAEYDTRYAQTSAPSG